MTKLTVDKDSLDVALNTPCPKCGETHWVVAQPSEQKRSIRPGAVKIRCKACEAARSKAWQQANSEKKKAIDKAWYEANPEKHNARSKAWKEANPTKVNALRAKRRAKKLQRTPSWANLDAIKYVYDACPPGYHVDHIIPLQGQLVSGLHVAENLQHLPALENCSKNNKFTVG